MYTKEQKREYDREHNQLPERKRQNKEAQVRYLQKQSVKIKYLSYWRNYSRNYYYKNKERMDRQAKEYRDGLKIEVLTYYGNGKFACVICGESRFPCLSIDHINNDGYRERKRLKKSKTIGHDFYIYLKKQGYPLGYQTLCMNCQFVKRFEVQRRKGELKGWN